jgi:hypothetical protein
MSVAQQDFRPTELRSVGVDAAPDYAHIALSYVVPCYFNKQDSSSLDALLRQYAGYSADVLDRIQFVIVDDGSPVPAVIAEDLDLNILLLRIGVDIPWNQPGAHNLGVVMARSDKVLMTDLDYAFPETTLRALIERPSPGTTMYRIGLRTPDGTPRKRHCNTFFCSRARVLRFYGYDESFSGHYGYDDTMFWRWQRYHGTRFRHLPRRIYGTERRVDYHTLVRDESHNRAIAERKRREMREHGPDAGHSRAFLRFPWEVVLDRARRTPAPSPQPNRWWGRTWWWRMIFPTP